MIDKFLKAKHWHLFILMLGLPILFQIIMMGTLLSTNISEKNSDPIAMFHMIKLIPIVMILYVGVLFGWFWSIAMGLQTKVPENIKMKTKKFKIFFFIPLIYLFFVSLYIGSQFSGLMQNGSAPLGGFMGGVIGIIITMHLLSLFGIFHSMYFVAKTIKTVELQKEVVFGDFVGEFLMLWFYFIGIWILQPKINKLAEDKNTATNNDFY